MPSTSRSRPPHTRMLAMLLTLLAVAASTGGCGDPDDADRHATAASKAGTSTAKPPGTVGRDGATSAADPQGSAPTRGSSAAARLPLSQLAGELVMTKLEGPTASDAELAAIRRLELGGVILFGPTVVDAEQVSDLVRSLDDARSDAAERAGLPSGVLVSVDQEGGSIRNVPFAPPERTQSDLGSGNDVDESARVARDTGAALRAIGVSIDLGPVADLAEGPNRTMAGRAFSGDPGRAARHVAATVRGLQSGGVAAAAKHFPGFGASSANSDEAVAHVTRSREQLEVEDLEPFRAAIGAGTDVVMVSHGIYSELGSSLPATLEPKVVTDVLREQLHFDGVAMTDSMNARGMRDAWGDTVPRACPKAVGAGIDLVLLTGSLETSRLCRQRILDAVADGSLPEERVREAAGRVIALRAKRAGALLVSRD